MERTNKLYTKNLDCNIRELNDGPSCCESIVLPSGPRPRLKLLQHLLQSGIVYMLGRQGSCSLWFKPVYYKLFAHCWTFRAKPPCLDNILSLSHCLDNIFSEYCKLLWIKHTKCRHKHLVKDVIKKHLHYHLSRGV